MWWTRPKSRKSGSAERLSLAGALLWLGALGCGGGSPGAVAPTGDAGFRDYIRSMDNTLVEINELERMGGGIRDRVVLVDGPSLVNQENAIRYREALARNYGKSRTLRSSLGTNEAVRDVLARNGHTLDEVVAINAQPGGVVVVYYDARTRPSS